MYIHVFNNSSTYGKQHVVLVNSLYKKYTFLLKCSNIPLSSPSVTRKKLVKYARLFDVIFQIKGIVYIPALLTLIKRLSDRQCAG